MSGMWKLKRPRAVYFAARILPEEEVERLGTGMVAASEKPIETSAPGAIGGLWGLP